MLVHKSFRICVLILIVMLTTKLSGSHPSNRQGNSQRQSRVPENSWRGLVPLESTRKEVETALGKPIVSTGATLIYEKDDESVNVLYSAGPCQGVRERWNVAKDTVIKMVVRPKKGQLVEELHLNPKTYQRELRTGIWVDYVNSEQGVVVHAVTHNNVDELTSLTYGPTRKDEILRCKN